MAMLVVDGVPIKEPSEMTYGLQDISASDAGRTQDTKMWKNRVGQKVKLNLAWSMPTPEETAAIMQAFDPEYFFVTYHDAKLNQKVTREFYAGDKTAPVHHWYVNDKRYTRVSFNIIER